MALGFTFNSVNFETYGLQVERGYTPPARPGREKSARGLPGTDSVIISRGTSRPLDIELPCRIKGVDNATLLSYLDTLETNLETTTTAALIISFWRSDRYWLAQWDGVPLVYRSLNPTCVKTTIRFIAQPNAYGNTEYNDHRAVAANPTTMWIPGPIEASGTVAGNSETYPVWEITNSGGDIASGEFQLWNYDTGDYIQYNDTFVDGAVIKIDSATGRFWLDLAGGGYVEQTGKITGSPKGVPLTGGVAGELRVIGMTGGDIEWTYRGRFI